MATQKHLDAPGTPGWHARRARCFNAGDASAMLGCHPSGKTRTHLLHELHTGIEREFSDYVQERVIDPGHQVEAALRSAAEDILGEDLQVIGYTITVDGISRPLGASLDGITFMEDTSWECKSANDALRAALPHYGRDSHEHNDARNLPKGYRVQMEQQMLASPSGRALFTAGQIDAAGKITEERHCWYASDPQLRAEILAGWRQFDADLAAYVPPAAAAPAVVAAPVQALPAVAVQVSGAIAITDNFKAFEVALRDFLEHRLIREPKTDQDFADLDVQIKAMKGAEAALDSAEGQMLAQIQTVDQAKKTKDMLAKLVRDNRLMAEKLLASEKERRRGEIVSGGNAALAAHLQALNQRLGGGYMPDVPANFAGVIKGLRTLASMEDARETELARAKIAANELADRIDVNLRHLREHAADFRALFPDTKAIILKAPDDLQALVALRIADHKAAEEKRLEAERARIRAEEEARARAQAAREQAEREAAERRQREEMEAQARRAQQEQEAAARAEQQRQQQAAAPAAEPPSTVVPMPTREPAATAPSLKLRDINERLSPLSIDAAGLAYLGFPPVGKEGAAKLYHDHDFPRICAAIVAHITARQQRKAA